MRTIISGIALALAIASPALAQTPQARSNFIDRLEKAFLSSGIDLPILVNEETPVPMPRPKGQTRPNMTINGYRTIVGRPFVYKAMTDWKILDNARAVGFNSVEIIGYDAQTWYFDLTGGVPQCDIDRSICR